MKKLLKTKTMTKKEINIFIENEYEQFEFPNDINLADITQKAIAMTNYFLSKSDWVQDSCLVNQNFSLLYFDIVFTDNERIQEINREYRKKDSATDVISFAIFADSPKEERFIFDGEINLGEIIISLDYTKEQAIVNAHENQSFKEELLFLIAHGILHLLGYDHQDEMSLQEMWDIQKEMLQEQDVN